MRELFILILTVLISCSKEPSISYNISFNESCLKDVMEYDLDLSCDFYKSDTTTYCSVIDTEKQFYFTDEDKDWLPFFCCEILGTILYTDGNNNLTPLVITDKKFINSRPGVLIPNCDETGKFERLCYHSEFAYIHLESELLDTWFSIRLSNPKNDPLSDNPKQATSIIISNNLDFNHLSALVVKNDYEPLANFYDASFHEEIEIHDILFQNVYSSRYVNHPDFIMMYYNKEYGLIAFEHEDKIWRIHQK